MKEKPYTDENEIVTWHYDHSKSRSIKGINIVNALYVNDKGCLPVNYDIIRKTKIVVDEKTGKEKRISEETKNEKYRRMLSQIVKNGIKFRYVLNDIWYASAENVIFVKKTIKKDFIMPVKSNRKAALTRAAQREKRFVSVSTLTLKEGTVQEVYLEDVSFPITLCKQVFKNEDGTTGELYLVSSNRNITYEKMTEFYKRRWKIEELHKSLKNNVSLAKSQTRVERTQRNHIFACMYAFIKLELLKMKTHLNHSAIKASIYAKAVKVAFEELHCMNGLHISLAR
ncbi:MAG: transposase [Ignavibacteriales bacterium]|nr:transposase [Ignavibacteriales bacterium]